MALTDAEHGRQEGVNDWLKEKVLGRAIVTTSVMIVISRQRYQNSRSDQSTAPSRRRPLSPRRTSSQSGSPRDNAEFADGRAAPEVDPEFLQHAVPLAVTA